MTTEILLLPLFFSIFKIALFKTANRSNIAGICFLKNLISRKFLHCFFILNEALIFFHSFIQHPNPNSYNTFWLFSNIVFFLHFFLLGNTALTFLSNFSPIFPRSWLISFLMFHRYHKLHISKTEFIISSTITFTPY